ncbi:MAG: MOSC domain-containing protein [Gluconacetobacter diazotrophicus]|nr:MOSC domain-containing protein [Gluconacetobacter diazotrophicus]
MPSARVLPAAGTALGRLLDAPPRPGRLDWIGLRPERRAPVRAVTEARLDPASGLPGDHWTGRPGGARQVTILQAEHLAAIASFLGRDSLSPELLRRNLLVSGINLAALHGWRLRIGAGAVLEITGPCAPCSRMEAILGGGGYNAVRGHGGVTATVLVAGTIRVGDPVARLDRFPDAPPDP